MVYPCQTLTIVKLKTKHFDIIHNYYTNCSKNHKKKKKQMLVKQTVMVPGELMVHLNIGHWDLRW